MTEIPANIDEIHKPKTSLQKSLILLTTSPPNFHPFPPPHPLDNLLCSLFPTKDYEEAIKCTWRFCPTFHKHKIMNTKSFERQKARTTNRQNINSHGTREMCCCFIHDAQSFFMMTMRLSLFSMFPKRAEGCSFSQFKISKSGKINWKTLSHGENWKLRARGKAKNDIIHNLNVSFSHPRPTLTDKIKIPLCS